MNLGTIKTMIEQDPTISNDIPGFLTRVNEKNIKKVERVITTVEDVVSFTSYAEQNGGLATERDVQEALKLISQEPLLAQAKQKYENAVTAIQSGEIKNSSDLTNALSASLEII